MSRNSEYRTAGGTLERCSGCKNYGEWHPIRIDHAKARVRQILAQTITAAGNDSTARSNMTRTNYFLKISAGLGWTES